MLAPTFRAPGPLEAHPKVGASLEGLALQATVRALGARPEQCSFWATHQGAELDLLVVQGPRRRGFEFGRETYPLAPKIRALAISRLIADLVGTRRPRRR